MTRDLHEHAYGVRVRWKTGSSMRALPSGDCLGEIVPQPIGSVGVPPKGGVYVLWSALKEPMACFVDDLEIVDEAATGAEFRLPDGAQFSAVYNAERVEWNVQLIIRAERNALANHGEMRFACSGHGLFGTLAKLDRKYRDEMGLPRVKRRTTKGNAKKGRQL